jgi:outer membrane protein TolC
VIFLLVMPTTAMSQGSNAGPDEAAVLADAAVKASPDLIAVGTGIKALQQSVRAAGAWIDPVLSLSYQNMPVDRWAPGASPMSGIQLSLKQTFYWPGKTEAREREAAALVTEQRQTLAEREVRLRAMVKQAYYRLALVRQLRQVTAEHIKLVEQFIDVVRVKYEVGKLGQQDLLRLQLLRDKLSDDLGNFNRDDTALSVAINAALHRPDGVAIRTPSRITPVQLRTDAAGLFKAAVQHRPLLKRYLAQAVARRTAAARAAREGYPDISAWFGYTFRADSGADPGTDFVSLGLSIPLPLSYDRRWGSLQSEHELQAKKAEQEREAELDRIRGELGRVVAAWMRAVEEARAYGSKLMPDAHRTLDATYAAYQVDRADFAGLSALARVEIEALVGGPLDKYITEEK